MPTFLTTDGTRLAYHLRGEGEPLAVLPGGPMRASAYLGDLGGLTAHRRLALLDLRGTGDSAVPADPETYRCDRMVEDVELWRAHLGLEHMDLLAHSAGAALAMLYAARRPHRIRRLVLITPNPSALGLRATPEDRLAAAELRKDEPWFADAFPAFRAWLAGEAGFDDVFLPFFHGRWDDTARAHTDAELTQTNEEAGERYFADGAFTPDATRAALAELTAPVLVYAGELDGGPRPDLARRAAQVFPNAESAVQPGAAHYPWLDDPEHFRARVLAFLDGPAPSVLPQADRPAHDRAQGRVAGMDTLPPPYAVEANGITLACRTWGPADAPPVVLLHCRGADGTDWTRIAERLAAPPRPRRVYAPDLRGHGHSGRAADYTAETMSEDVRALITALGIDGADVVGHSLGGLVAYLLAQRHPAAVRRLVLEDVCAPVPLDPPRPPAEHPGGELPFDWAMVRATDAQRNTPDPVWRDHMDRITMPTLVIGGGPTSLVPQDQVALLAELIPDARLVTVDAGHLVHESRPEEFLAVLEDFLDR
ncbi:alpha/beta fold hydrolase [Streptomyces sp. NPDC014846]|uniref:alpha/beta fold hydrolase n=1 Tax=Streptomyces sp. NPDC014846 TaxID=3364922 RepID=UPI0036F815E4